MRYRLELADMDGAKTHCAAGLQPNLLCPPPGRQMHVV